MLLEIALAAALSQAPQDAPLQVLNGPAFERLLNDVQARCPTPQVRFTSPAALLDTEDTFAETLPRGDFRRLRRDTPASASPEGEPCGDRPGASCPANATLTGIQRAGLERRFVRLVCERGDGAWG